MTRVYDTATDLITFARNSTATYLDSSGVIQSAAVDTPRIDYGSDGSLKALLIEEQRTNLITYSEDFLGNWGKNFSPTTTENASTGPDGILSMSRISASGTSGSGVYKYVANPTGVATYTFSVFIRAVSNAGNISLRLEGSSLSNSGIIYDAHTAAFVSNSNAIPDAYTIEDFGDEIYRVSVTATTTGAGTLAVTIYDNSTAGAVFDVYGAQLEEGSFPTSYIPTSGSQRTRSADVASIPVTAFGYNDQAGTIVAEYSMVAGAFSGSPYIVQFDDGSAGSRFLIMEISNQSRFFMNDGGVTQDTIVNEPISEGVLNKTAVAFVENSTGVSTNGSVAEAGDGTSTVPGGVTTVRLGGSTSTNAQLNGHIKSLKYYPRRLTDAQLQELTA